MIVIFEGPQGTGKTTLLGELTRELTKRSIPFEQWKVPRGADPIADMNASLDTEFKERKVYLLDRFHLSEWVISRGTRRNWGTQPEWTALEAQLRLIDERLRNMNSLIFLITASPYFVEKRLSKLNKQDVLGDASNASYWWRIGAEKTRVDCVHLVNNDFYQMRRDVLIMADLIDMRWSEHLHEAGSGDLEDFAKELDPSAGIIEGTEEGTTPSD